MNDKDEFTCLPFLPPPSFTIKDFDVTDIVKDKTNMQDIDIREYLPNWRYLTVENFGIKNVRVSITYAEQYRGGQIYSYDSSTGILTVGTGGNTGIFRQLILRAWYIE